MKIVVILHLFYQDLWDEFNLYLSNIENDFDLYITLCKDHDNELIKEKILSRYPNSNIILVENRGADIGPFFVVMNQIIKSEKNYDYLLKMHTKKTLRKEKKEPGLGDLWRKSCIEPLIKTKENVENCLNLLSVEKNGIVGAESQLNENIGRPNVRRGGKPIGANTKFHKVLKKWVLEGKKHQVDIHNKCKLQETPETFFAGTMFWCKFWPIKKYISRCQIDQSYFPFGDHSKGNTQAHAMERIFCKFFLAEGLDVIGVK